MRAVAPVHAAGPLTYRSARMARLMGLARRVARSEANVLLCGESGTGKGALARFLHEASPRGDGPFVTITCANLPGELLESELFGHEKGAFTGATERRIGRFEQADGGTILIDGVSELAPAPQGKLLRVVQERCFERLAGTRTLRVDVRILTSSQVDLEPMVASGGFRKDLFYRLNVIRLDLPPLRDRLEDLALLAEAILEDLAGRWGKRPARLTPGALNRLMRHDWPGNVRELRNVLESAAIRVNGNDIPAEAIRVEPAGLEGPFAAAARGGQTLEQVEAAYIREVLRHTGGNRTEAARILAINRKTLLEKRRRYGIP
ncbi:MAG: sigma-54 interaction domain-containing protein [Acidobacteriota bacterium]